jgi:hypothetical protein
VRRKTQKSSWGGTVRLQWQTSMLGRLVAETVQNHLVVFVLHAHYFRWTRHEVTGTLMAFTWEKKTRSLNAKMKLIQ